MIGGVIGAGTTLLEAGGQYKGGWKAVAAANQKSQTNAVVVNQPKAPVISPFRLG